MTEGSYFALDSETTGIDWRAGHRVIEIGVVEIVDRKLTGRNYHVYINPGREIDEEAFAVHGIGSEFLQDKPSFKDVANEFLEFVSGGHLLIHNAPFDTGFINNELASCGFGDAALNDACTITDTLHMAKSMYPGQRASLDALCRRFGISNAHRTLHGALLDADLLAQVYLHMTGGQTSIDLEPIESQEARTDHTFTASYTDGIVHQPTTNEIRAHSDYLSLLSDKSSKEVNW